MARKSTNKSEREDIIRRLERGEFVGATPEEDQAHRHDGAPPGGGEPDEGADQKRPQREPPAGRGRPKRTRSRSGERAERTPDAEAEAAALYGELVALLGRVRATTRPFRKEFQALLRRLEDRPFFDRNADAVDHVNALLALLELRLCDPDDETLPAYLCQVGVPDSHGGNIVLRTRQAPGAARRVISARTRMPRQLTAHPAAELDPRPTPQISSTGT